MTLTTSILLVLALYLVQIFLQETTRYHFDMRQIVGPRDNPPEMTILAARLDRAKNNLLEAFPFFLGLAMLDLVKLGDSTPLAVDGAMVFLIARIAYVPAYVSGVPLLRSVIWMVANTGLVMMAWPLIF